MDREQENLEILMPSDWIEQQMKTFTVWINMHLKKRGLRIENIKTDLSDGRMFQQLLEIISGETLPVMEKKNTRVHKVNNVNRCLEFIAKNKVRLTNIGSEEIVDCNLKCTLGCIWCLILRFAIQSHEELGANNGLLLWVKKKTEGYKGVDVKNFTTSFSDGLAFNALIHRHRPDLLDYDKLGKDPNFNLNQAFEIADRDLGIPRMLDVADMIAPDQKSVMTYVSAMYHEFSKNQVADNAARRINRLLDTNAENANKIQEYERIASELLKWIKAKTDEFEAFSPENQPLDTLVNKLNDLNRYRNEEKPPKFKDKATLENLSSAIKTRMHLQNRPDYNPIHGHSLKDIQGAWDILSDHERTLLERLLLLIRQLSQIDNLLKKYYNKCNQQDEWTKERANPLTVDVSKTTLFQLRGIKSKLVELTNEIESRESRLAPITSLRDRLNDLQCSEMDKVNERHTSVLNSWKSLKDTLASYKSKIAEHESILLDIDTKKQQYAQLASDLRSFFEYQTEDLNDTYLVDSVAETEHLQTELNDIGSDIEQRRTKLADAIALEREITSSIDPVNDYCSISSSQLESKLAQLKSAENSRKTALTNELVNQKHNDTLKQDFAKLANEIEQFRVGILAEVHSAASSSSSLEDHVHHLKESASKMESYYKNKSPELDTIGKTMQEKKIYHNQYTSHTFESINTAYQQLFELLASSISEVENQIIVRDSSNITEQQVKDYRKSFDYFDKEKLNYLNYEDFRAFLISLEFNVPVGDVAGDEEFRRILGQVDHEHSLRVTFNSFLNFVAVENKQTDNAEQIIKAFKALCGDKDYINESIIRQHFPKKADDMISKMTPSTNPDAPPGSLDYKSFVATIYGETDL